MLSVGERNVRNRFCELAFLGSVSHLGLFQLPFNPCFGLVNIVNPGLILPWLINRRVSPFSVQIQTTFGGNTPNGTGVFVVGQHLWGLAMLEANLFSFGGEGLLRRTRSDPRVSLHGFIDLT